MLPSNVNKVLVDNLKWCFDDNFSKDLNKFVTSEEDREYFHQTLKVKNLDSAFIDFYSVVAFVPTGKGEELYNLESILEENNSENFDDEIPKEVGSRYLKFTSMEGEGSYFYDVETDAVYDVNWGEEELMVSGEKQPWFTSFYDFIEWYYAE